MSEPKGRGGDWTAPREPKGRGGDGTEAVIPVEWADGGTARVTVRGQAEYVQSVRLAGGDAKAGEVLVTAGTRLRPMHIAVIAAAGRGAVRVRPRPRVVVLSTGSE